MAVGATSGQKAVNVSEEVLNIELLNPHDTTQMGEAASVLARSFQNTANFTSVFENASRRAHALPHFFRMLLTDAAPLDSVTLATSEGKIIGVAVWYPPGLFRMTLARQLRVMPPLVRTFLAAPSSFSRLTRLGAELTKHHPSEPHWYLAAIGVEEAFQGHGVGSRLLAAGIARAEETAHACYLETFSERNVQFYEAHGFEVRRSGVHLLPEGPPFWFMWCPPANV